MYISLPYLLLVHPCRTPGITCYTWTISWMSDSSDGIRFLLEECSLLFFQNSCLRNLNARNLNPPCPQLSLSSIACPKLACSSPSIQWVCMIRISTKLLHTLITRPPKPVCPMVVPKPLWFLETCSSMELS